MGFAAGPGRTPRRSFGTGKWAPCLVVQPLCFIGVRMEKESILSESDMQEVSFLWWEFIVVRVRKRCGERKSVREYFGQNSIE